MKRIGLSIGALVIIGAVAFILLQPKGGNPNERRYELTFKTDDAEKQGELVDAAVRVITRKLASMTTGLDGVVMLADAPEIWADGTTVIVQSSDAPLLDALSDDLLTPFTFNVMRLAEEGETPDVTVEQQGSFVRTSVDGTDIVWLEADADPQFAGRGQVSIAMTEAGQNELKSVYESNIGKVIGVFVKDRLVAKLLVDASLPVDQFLISGVSTPDIAQVFADDVNVGLLVTFSSAS